MGVRSCRVPSACRRLLAVVGLAGACAVPYQPCPVDVPLPSDAFERCRGVLFAIAGGLVVAEADPLRLQSDWYEVPERQCERRATVHAGGRGLEVVVEARWLTTPWLGTPTWSEARPDPAAERELADRLRAALTTP